MISLYCCIIKNKDTIKQKIENHKVIREGKPENFWVKEQLWTKEALITNVDSEFLRREPLNSTQAQINNAPFLF